MKLWNEREKAQETEVERKNGSQRKYEKEEKGVTLRVKKVRNMKDFMLCLLSKMKSIGGREEKEYEN